MKPAFQSLLQNHYSTNKDHPKFKDSEEVYAELGLSLAKLTRENGAYGNTCAVRLSLAFFKTNVSFQGRLRAQGGKFKGMLIEPGTKLLADQLVKIWGWPEIYQRNDAAQKLMGNQRVVFFNKIDNYGGGHIDLLKIGEDAATCNSDCYWTCKEVWFWSLR